MKINAPNVTVDLLPILESESTSISAPQQFKQEVFETYQPHILAMKERENDLKKLLEAKEYTSELGELAHDLKRFYKNARLSSEKERKLLKGNLKAKTDVIDLSGRLIRDTCQNIENFADEFAKYEETLEKQRLEKLFNERLHKIQEYIPEGVNPSNFNLSGMSEDEFDQLFMALKAKAENDLKSEEEAKAEAIRLEEENKKRAEEQEKLIIKQAKEKRLLEKLNNRKEKLFSLNIGFSTGATILDYNLSDEAILSYNHGDWKTLIEKLNDYSEQLIVEKAKKEKNQHQFQKLSEKFNYSSEYSPDELEFLENLDADFSNICKDFEDYFSYVSILQDAVVKVKQLSGPNPLKDFTWKLFTYTAKNRDDWKKQTEAIYNMVELFQQHEDDYAEKVRKAEEKERFEREEKARQEEERKRLAASSDWAKLDKYFQDFMALEAPDLIDPNAIQTLSNLHSYAKQLQNYVKLQQNH